MSIIETQNLSYLYSEGTPFEKLALNDVSIKIEKGDFVGIIGHTGSGKSTLVQHFNGLIHPKSGRIIVDGIDISKEKSKLHSLKFKVGLVFQYPEYQIFEDTVYKDIAYGPRNMGLNEEETDSRVKEAIRLVGLNDDYLDRSPFRLSGGEMRRAAIAGVMAMKPQVLVLDEPAAGLDPYGRDMILKQIEEYRKESGSTVIIVSHSMEDIANTAKKVIVMHKGAAIMWGSTEEIFERAEELEKIGLSIPQITKVFIQLNKLGIKTNPHIFTLDQAEQEILRLLKKEAL